MRTVTFVFLRITVGLLVCDILRTNENRLILVGQIDLEVESRGRWKDPYEWIKKKMSMNGH